MKGFLSLLVALSIIISVSCQTEIELLKDEGTDPDLTANPESVETIPQPEIVVPYSNDPGCILSWARSRKCKRRYKKTSRKPVGSKSKIFNITFKISIENFMFSIFSIFCKSYGHFEYIYKYIGLETKKIISRMISHSFWCTFDILAHILETAIIFVRR